MTDFKPSVALDLDGVLAKYDTWRGVEHIGEPIDGAQEFVRSLLAEGFRVIIHTTRLSVQANPPPTPSMGGPDKWIVALVNRVARWWEEHRFPSVENNEVSFYVAPGKPLAFAFVDDRAVVCAPEGFRGYSYRNALAEVQRLHCEDAVRAAAAAEVTA